MKFPISAMIVGFNEGHSLEECLNSISFCNEIVYTDLGSSDESVRIAKKYTEKIFLRDKKNIPSGEYAHADMVQHTINDWVLFIDPDEKVDPELANELQLLFLKVCSSESIGAILVPWVFYFKGKRLRGTAWGMENKKYLLVNKNRFDFLPITHYGRKLKDGFECKEIKKTSADNVLHHYWATSLINFILKHQRYLRKEGIDQYNAGHRISKIDVLLTPAREFAHSALVCKGYKNGLLGLFLSLFWAYYKTYSAVDLLFIQRKNRKSH